MKLLGLDFGTVRVGLALGDSESRLSFPFKTIEVSRVDLINELQKIVAAENIETMVVGVPYSVRGLNVHSETYKMACSFVEQLRNNFAIPVEEVDERWSSVYADRIIKESGGGDRDAIAAAGILETYLAKL